LKGGDRLELLQGIHFHDSVVAEHSSCCSPMLDLNSGPSHFAADCCLGQVHNQKSLSAFSGSDASHKRHQLILVEQVKAQKSRGD